ncbi:hypothetical protein PR001_g31031, partial [Phytophthora rubi]
RWTSGSIRVEVPCPSVMRDYHRWMGGVDIHDQLRLQRYSLQQQTKCKKYYKAIFWGLVDVAVVNAYIVFREAQKKRGAKLATHAEFLTQLQAQMLELSEEDFAEVDMSDAVPRSLPSDHVPRENPDYQIIHGQRKRRQRQCKVCSIRKRFVGERRATKFYCPGCSPSDKARTYLCNKVWPHYKNNTLTCHQIWHFQWKNGTERPRPRCGRDIQNREAGGGAGKRKRRRQPDEEDTAARGDSAGEEEQDADAGAGADEQDAIAGEEEQDADADEEEQDAHASEEEPDADADEEEPDAGAGEEEQDADADESAAEEVEESTGGGDKTNGDEESDDDGDKE